MKTKVSPKAGKSGSGERSGVSGVRVSAEPAGGAVAVPANPEEAVQMGGRLMDASRLDEAETLYAATARSFPQHPAGLVGLAEVAARRQKWAEALACWDRVLDTFSDRKNPFWLKGHAIALFEAGNVEQASSMMAELIRDYPSEPAGYSGFATLALRQGRWSETLRWTNELLTRFADWHGRESWNLMRAQALLELRRAGEAEAIVEEAWRKSPRSLPALLLLLRLYNSTGRLEATLRALDASSFQESAIPALLGRRLDALVRLKRFDEARAIFRETVPGALDSAVLSCLFEFVPALSGGEERQGDWVKLLKRAAAVESSIGGPDQIALNVLRARIRLALRDREGFVKAMRELEHVPNLGEHGAALRRVAVVLNEPGYPDYQKSRIFCIGLSKTGTTTLSASLRLLGFHTIHWHNELTGEEISEEDFPIYDAFADSPVLRRFEKLYDAFPNSKFILTTRPMESWLTSMDRHNKRRFGLEGSGDRGQIFDREAHIRAYDAYEERVRSFFRSKAACRFLELNIFEGEGWEKLCPFVGREEPRATPFPWENREPAVPGAGT